MTLQRIKQQILTGISTQNYKPLVWEKLAARIGVHKQNYDLFKQEIDELHRSGRLLIGEDQTIRLAAPAGAFVGTFRKNQRGFGFVVSSDPQVLEDLFIPKTETKDAVSGDIVMAKVSKRRVKGETKTYGRIEKILARGKNKITGHLYKTARKWMVRTDGRMFHQPIMVDDVGAKSARTGDRVVVQLTEYPQAEKMARGVIVEVLGASGEPDVELRAVIEDFDLPTEFPLEVQTDLDNVIDAFNLKTKTTLDKGEVPKKRLDIRDKITITIDPDDARDFDDAISLEINAKGYELGVHIADVSAFVQENAPLDIEARNRGNSVYLPRMVIPMIPEALSNGLCSLQENQDRLTKSAFIQFNKNGKVLSSRCENTVIRSNKRLTYNQATSILAGDDKFEVEADVKKIVFDMDALAKAIYKHRAGKGMLHLDLPEVELEYNDKGELIDAHPADTSFSHTIIEMFMVEANEAVARLLNSYNIPFIRRIHPDPSPQAFTQLSDFLTVLGHKVSRQPDRLELQMLIDSVEGEPESFAVSYAVLRSLQRAEYSPQVVGHFALASKHYVHFTSPIRRYPDLHIHRLLDLHFEGKLKALAAQLRQEEPQFSELASHCCFTETRAQNAERQIKETLIIQLLSEQIGEHFDGVVTGVSGLGPFVRLPKYIIEGLIPVDQLGDDWWELNQEKGLIKGQRSGVRFRIGDPIRVVLVSADPITRRLNFAIAEEFLSTLKEQSKTGKRGKASRASKPSRSSKTKKSAKPAKKVKSKKKTVKKRKRSGKKS